MVKFKSFKPAFNDTSPVLVDSEKMQFQFLPVDVLFYICKFLPIKAILNLAETNKYFRFHIQFQEQLWKLLCERDFNIDKASLQIPEKGPNRWKILYMEFCTRLDENHKNETVILTNQGRTAQAVLAKWCSGDKRFHQKSHTNIHFRSHKISWKKKRACCVC